MRKEVTEPYYRVFAYQQVDRVPDIEFGYWPQTVRRWLKEGLTLEMTREEQNSYWISKLDDFLGLDRLSEDWLRLRLNMNPAPVEEIIERKEKSVIARDTTGAIYERFLVDVEEASIPHYIKFPVEAPKDWETMKERYRFDDPARDIPQEDIKRVAVSAANGKMISVFCHGPYGLLRNFMGFENLSLAFYEYPDMIHNMVDHITELTLRQIRKLPSDLPIDNVGWWEDMASKNGPFVSPKMFREFLQPSYHEIMNEVRKHGCAISMVDCDGNPHDLVANWLEEGVNIMFPLEVTAGVDPYAWRKEFGMEMRLRGGIEKHALAISREAIDKELERIKPLLCQGGFIPHLDHVVPPDVSYDNYRYYLERKRKLIGKE